MGKLEMIEQEDTFRVRQKRRNYVFSLVVSIQAVAFICTEIGIWFDILGEYTSFYLVPAQISIVCLSILFQRWKNKQIEKS